MAISSKKAADGTLHCNFCGKSQYEVRKLIAGPSVFICNECVDLCNGIIREEDKGALLAPSEDLPALVAANMARVDKYVPGNVELKREVSLDAASRLFAGKAGASGMRARALFVGPPGCGISEILRLIWTAAGSAVVVTDACQLRETRLVGPSNLFNRVMQACNFDLEQAGRSTIIIENVDRLATGTDEARKIQEELEVVIRGSLVPVADQSNKWNLEGVTLDTSSISFFAISSALHLGRPPIVPGQAGKQKRLGENPDNLVNLLEARGFIRPLIQAFDVVREYEPIMRTEFEEFLRSPDSEPLAEWRRMLGDESVELDEPCMDELLNQVERRRSGLQALHGIMRVVAMRIAFERHSSSEPMVAITPDWLRENL
jgi:ATP-dependent Clp protease ATP-binding subunit ClpX